MVNWFLQIFINFEFLSLLPRPLQAVSKCFLYEIHSSGSFMTARSLAGALYLVLLLFLKQEYEAVCKMVTSITCDEEFNAEDEMVFRQLAATIEDVHPNAHSCRLKISLAVNAVHGLRWCPWDVGAELQVSVPAAAMTSAVLRFSASTSPQCKAQQLKRKDTLGPPGLSSRTPILRTAPKD